MSRQRGPLDGRSLDHDFAGYDPQAVGGNQPDPRFADPHGQHAAPQQAYDPAYPHHAAQQPPQDPNHGGGIPHGQAPYSPHEPVYPQSAAEQHVPRTHYPEHVPADMAGTSYVYPDPETYAQPDQYAPHGQHPHPVAPAQPYSGHAAGQAIPPAEPSLGGYPAQQPVATPHQHGHPLGHSFGQPGADTLNVDPHAQPALRGASYDDRYDLGSYPPRADDPLTQQPTAQPHQDHFGAAHPTTFGEAHQDYQGQQHPQPPGADPAQVYGFDPYGRPQHETTDAMAPVAQDDRYDEYEYDDEEDEQDRTSGRSKLMVGVAAVLVASVAIGGGLAFGYNQLFGGGGKTSSSPVVLSGTTKTREAPKDAGGRRFANTDSKLLDRLDSGRGVSGSNSDRTRAAADRVRTVSTHIVRPDGTLVQSERPRPAPTSAPKPSGPAVSSPIPGMTLVGVTPSQPSQPAPPRQERRVTVPPVTRSAPTTVTPGLPRPANVRPSTPPVVIANATPVTRPGSAVAPATAVTAPTTGRASNTPLPVRNTFPRVQRTAPVRQASAAGSAVRTVRPAAPPTPPATSAAGGTSPGFVAVLASKPNRMDALATFADLRSRYGNVLSSSIPEVQEADLSSRGLGTMYRVVVGPPGSREAANGLCDQLKGVGYTNCWVKRY